MRFVSRLASLVLVAAVCPASFAAGARAQSIPIAGQVSAGGEPAEGVAVILLPVTGPYGAGELRLTGRADPEPEVEVRTEAAGRFELTAPAAGFWRLRFELEGRVPREIRLEPLLYATELGEVELESDAGLRLRIRAGGEPAAARVVAYPIDRTMSRMVGRAVRLSELGGSARPLFAGGAGERGDLRVPASGEEKAWRVEVAADGFVPLLHQASGRPRQLDLTLGRGVSREIRTVDAGGEPLAGVLLFSGDGYLPLAKTGEVGGATLVLPAEAGLTLTALDPLGRHGSLRLEPVAEGAAERPEIITLESPRTISGRVVAERSREPIAGAVVWTGTADSARTDAEGGYSVRLPAPGPRTMGRIEVQAAAAGYVAGRESAPLQGTAGPTLALAPAAGLGGRVVDAEGAGLAGVGIEAEPLTGDRRRFRRPGPQEVRRARSAKDGRFELAGLATGRGYRLRLVKAGYAPGRLEVAALEPFERRSGLEAVLDRGRRAFGLVVDEQELPVAGAVVRLTAPADPRRRRMRLREVEDQVPEDVTGIDGRFAIPDLTAGRYDLKVESPGFGPVTVPGVEVPPDAGDIDLGTVFLPPAVAIEGQVVDAEGTPLAGVEIRPGEPSNFPLPAAFRLMRLAQVTPTVTAADGHFAVPDRRAGERLDLVVAGEGYVAMTVASVVVPPEEPLRIVLQRASRVSGRVVDERGEPVADAGVQARPEGLGGSGGRRMAGFHRARSNADGHFELVDVEPGNVTLAAEAEGFQETLLSGLEAPAGGELRDVELVLRPGATVAGSVTGADGAPVAGVVVTISAGGRERPEGFATTDGDGRFRLTGVGFGRRTLSARDDDGRQVSKGVDVEAGSQTVELRFAGGTEVSGRVIDPTGAGLAGAGVWLDDDPRGGFRRGKAEAASSADGGFTFENVAPGSYYLTAGKEGFADARNEQQIKVGANPVHGLEIELGEGATLSGRILGLELDDLAQVEVRSGSRSGKVVLDFEGGYSIRHLPTGMITVSATIPGSGRQVRERITIEEAASEVVLDLDFGSGFRLTGTVVAGERPVAGASVRVSGANFVTTDTQGRFRIEGLEAGSYHLWVRSFESGVEHHERVELLDDDDVRIQVGSGRAAGRVRDRASGDAVAGVRLTLFRAGSQETFRLRASGATARALGGKSATSDSRGNFSFAAVPAGSWRLSASKAGYAEAEIAFDTLSGEVVEDLEILLAATAGFAFEVVSAAGVPPARVEVAVLDAAGQSIAGGDYRTLDGGRVELTTVPAGSWEMLIAGGDSATLSLQITAPGEAGRIQLSPGGAVRVEVPNLADGNVGASVELVGPDGRRHRGIQWGGAVASRFGLYAGRTVVPNLAPGPWTVEVRSGDRSWSASVLVTPGEPVAVTLY